MHGACPIHEFVFACNLWEAVLHREVKNTPEGDFIFFQFLFFTTQLMGEKKQPTRITEVSPGTQIMLFDGPVLWTWTALTFPVPGIVCCRSFNLEAKLPARLFIVYYKRPIWWTNWSTSRNVTKGKTNFFRNRKKNQWWLVTTVNSQWSNVWSLIAAPRAAVVSSFLHRSKKKKQRSHLFSVACPLFSLFCFFFSQMKSRKVSEPLSR